MKKFIYLFALLLMGTSALAEGLVDGDFTAGDWGSTSPTLRASNIDVGWGSGRKWTYDAANNQVELPSSTAPWNGFGQRFASTFTGTKRLSVNWNQPAGAGSFVIQVFGLGSANNLVTGYITSDAESSQPPTGSGWVSLGYFVSPAGAFNGTSHVDIDMDASLYNDYGVRICAAKNSGAKVTSVSLALAAGPARISYAGVTNEPVKPGELQDVRVIIQNDGLDVSNMVATLTTKDGSLFSVHNGPFSNAFLAANTSFTNTFSVTASNAIMSGIVEAFDLSVTADATDGSSTNLQTAVSIEILDTAFSSMPKTNFLSAVSGVDTATVTVSNTAAFPLQFALSSTNTWLTYPTGTLTLAPGTPTNITVTATDTLGDGHYKDTLSVTYLNNGSTPGSIPVTFDVGAKVSFIGEGIIEDSGVNDFPGKNEPGEILWITVTNLNDGALDLTTVTNRLSADTSAFTITALSPSVYPTLTRGQTAFTVYKVEILPAAIDKTYTFDVQNANADGSWTNQFPLTVFKQAMPSVSPSALSIEVIEGRTASGSITLTNAGNDSTTFAISDPTAWISHSPQAGSIAKHTGVTIDIDVDASAQSAGTTIFTNTVTWGGTNAPSEVVLTVNVLPESIGLKLSTNVVVFIGPAGGISSTNVTLINTGSVEVAYSITDATSESAGFTWATNTFDWDAALNQRALPLPGTNHTGWLPIDFDFSFYGKAYDQFFISEDGFLRLGSNPTNYNSDQWIAPLFVPGLPGDSSLFYFSDANRLVVTWLNIQHTFQAVLGKDGTILFQYYGLHDTITWPEAIVGVTNNAGPSALTNLVNDTTRTWETNEAFVITNVYTYTTNLTSVWSNEYSYTTNLTYEYQRDEHNNPVLVTITNITTHANPVLVTVETVTTNANPTWVTNITTNIVYDSITDYALLFSPGEPLIITVSPLSGTIPEGGRQRLDIYGDARGLTAGGPNSPTASSSFSVIPSGGSQPPALDVTFTATNSAETAFAALADSDGDGRTDGEEAMFGSDGFVDVVQNSDGSRTLSWMTPTDSIYRNFTVWYTLDLTSGWTKILPTLGNNTSFRDDDPIRNAAPVIYYKVTVE